MNKMYKEIKKELLKDLNIYNVSINSNKRLIEIKPMQNKSFYNIYEPLENFIYDKLINNINIYKICNKEFIFKEGLFSNTNILIIKLVELTNKELYKNE